MTVQINIVQKRPSAQYQETVRILRKSSQDVGNRIGEASTVENQTQDAGSALERLQQRLEAGGGIDFGILVLLGFTRTEVAQLRDECERSQIEIICSNLDWDCDEYVVPFADMNSRFSFGDEQHIGEALRKSWLRGRLHKQGIHIRKIQAEPRDLEDYFALRYGIYKAEQYIPIEYDATTAGLELNYSDRWAIPIGAFAVDGRLVGCIRVVEEFGHDNEYKSVIDRLIESKADAALDKAWAMPSLPYPFDMCLFFNRFDEYYHHLVREQLAKAEVSRVIVHPDYRRHGLGEVLVDTAVSLARAKNLDLLFLACREAHAHFYEQSGFRRLPDLECDRFGQYQVRSIAMERRFTDRGGKHG